MPTALVTGAGVRVGAAIASRLAKASYSLAIHYNSSKDEALALSRDIESKNGVCRIFRADLTRSPFARDLVEEVAGSMGGLDLLVNSAAVLVPDNSPLEDLARMKLLNFDAPSVLMDAAVPHLKASGGSIVNIADVAGFVEMKRHKAYSRTKKALIQRTCEAALELAPVGIRVNAVCPGTVLFPDDYPETLRQSVAGGIPMGRTGSPEDVAKAVEYLASASFVTGQTLCVDGGRLLQLLTES